MASLVAAPVPPSLIAPQRIGGGPALHSLGGGGSVLRSLGGGGPVLRSLGEGG